MEMEMIQQKVIQYRYHIVVTALGSIIIAFFLYAAPRLVSYFWPLLASTTVFLVAIIAFGGHSQSQAHGEKAGQGLLDYVANSRAVAEHHHHHTAGAAEELPQKFE
ncbi:hypothetical protein CCACVL1_15265 [Corchorus capsularis]|uniref:Uncharacterized protein n=1 Tax=Corchorus capsularis TaxID=210143 RepID=A0A1R3I315_COCAP|nr:hypothetical protein CCACVL1_15265 [Corchorus capsularis]